MRTTPVSQKVFPVHEFDPADFHRILVLESPFLLVHAAPPPMSERGWGRVVSVSSAHGLCASPDKSAYVPAGHNRLEGLSRTIAMEAAAHGVTGNCVNPGCVRTPLVEKQVADRPRMHGTPQSEVVERIMFGGTPVKKLVEPEGVGSLVAWPAGPHASRVTGASCTMDGGWAAR